MTNDTPLTTFTDMCDRTACAQGNQHPAFYHDFDADIERIAGTRELEKMFESMFEQIFDVLPNFDLPYPEDSSDDDVAEWRDYATWAVMKKLLG